MINSFIIKIINCFNYLLHSIIFIFFYQITICIKLLKHITKCIIRKENTISHTIYLFNNSSQSIILKTLSCSIGICNRFNSIFTIISVSCLTLIRIYNFYKISIAIIAIISHIPFSICFRSFVTSHIVSIVLYITHRISD